MRPFIAKITGIENNAADNDIDHDRSPDVPDGHSQFCKNQGRNRESEECHRHAGKHGKERIAGGLDRTAVNDRHTVEQQINRNEAEHDFRQADHLRITLIEQGKRDLRKQDEENRHEPPYR